MFEIGDRVVCIDASMRTETVEELKKDVPNWVVKDEKYIIRGFADNNGIVTGVWLEEIKNPPKYFALIDKIQEPAFATWRFRKREPAELTAEEKHNDAIDELFKEQGVEIETAATN